MVSSGSKQLFLFLSRNGLGAPKMLARVMLFLVNSLLISEVSPKYLTSSGDSVF